MPTRKLLLSLWGLLLSAALIACAGSEADDSLPVPTAEAVLNYAEAVVRHPSVNRADAIGVLDKWMKGELSPIQADRFVARIGGTETGCNEDPAKIAACAACAANCAIQGTPTACACMVHCQLCAVSAPEPAPASSHLQ